MRKAIFSAAAVFIVFATAGESHGKGREMAAHDKGINVPSLYAQLGGDRAIDALVDLFYQKALADDRVNSFFKGLDMSRQKSMMESFLTFAFGGPNGYTGRNLRVAHAGLVKNKGLNDSHFDIMIGHLQDTLTELGVADELIKQAVAAASSMRKDVLNK